MMKGVVSGLVAFCVACVVAVFFGYLCAGLLPTTARLSLFAGALAGAWAWVAMSGGVAHLFHPRAPEGSNALDERQPISGWVDWAVVTVFMLFALRGFLWVIFWRDSDIQFLSSFNLGDLSLHVTFINYLANGAPFWPENPIYAGTELHYPFGVDLFNSLLTLVGVPLVRGLVWVGLMAALAAAVALRRWGGTFMMAAFLFNGGVAGFAVFTTMHWSDGHLHFVLKDYLDQYANPDGSPHPIAWKSIPLAFFVTQRGFLYAIPTGLTLLWSWRARLFRGQRSLPFPIESLLYATMPLFHVHTFIFLSVMVGFWGSLAFLARQWPAVLRSIVPEPDRLLRATLRIVAWALVPAFFFFWKLTGLHGGGTIHWLPGWIQDENFFVFWFRNLGFLPFCVAALFVWLWMRRGTPESAELTMITVPAVLFFVVTCFVMFAAAEWDNTKLMIWCYFAVMPGIWVVLRTQRWSIRAGVCVALFFSGFISLPGGLDLSHQKFPLAARPEIDGLIGPLRQFPISTTFAAYPDFNHPLLILGYKLVAGYSVHLSSHGIDCKERLAKLEKLLLGQPGWEQCARELKADYLYWGSLEELKCGSSSTPWRTRLPQVASGNWGVIYDLRGLRNGDPSRLESSSP